MNKYKVAPKARRTDADGIVFDSRGEMLRWNDLKLLEKCGKISHLRRQVAYGLHAFSGQQVSVYKADFVYVENEKEVVEDFKGVRTALYRLKKKWMKAEHGIVIRETK